MGRALITDLYELNMVASYLRRSMTQAATFSLFVRELPPERGFVVAAGLEACLDYLESFAFTEEDTDWMAGHGFSQEAVAALGGMRFTGDVYAVPEGRVVLAGEPFIEVTAPLPEAQIVETYLLNQMTFQSALATKAVRCRLAAGEMALVDFALRRTHGTEAALAVARVSAIAGFVATSNVDAARRLGLHAAGTMAHSYVEAFEREADAFVAFTEDLPGPYTFLVDTYDTIEGVKIAAEVIQRLRPPGPLAVRLDSGDLAALSIEARQVLDAAGLHDVAIFASGSLDEYALQALRVAGAPVDAAGIGTRLGVSSDAPYLDSVYKLVEVGARPVAKFSTGKETLPGAKQVWRGQEAGDLLTLREEEGPAGAEPLLVPVMRGGRRIGPADTIAEAKRRLSPDLAWLPPEAKRIDGPVQPPLSRSEALDTLARTMKRSVLARTRREVLPGGT